MLSTARTLQLLDPSSILTFLELSRTTHMRSPLLSSNSTLEDSPSLSNSSTPMSTPEIELLLLEMPLTDSILLLVRASTLVSLTLPTSPTTLSKPRNLEMISVHSIRFSATTRPNQRSTPMLSQLLLSSSRTLTVKRSSALSSSDQS